MAIQRVRDVLLEADQAEDQWLDPPTFLDTSMGAGLDDLHRSLPTQTSLGFCEVPRLDFCHCLPKKKDFFPSFYPLRISLGVALI